jgi:predicted RNA binding protein YcfA (HicA-like mRNA interferase family)
MSKTDKIREKILLGYSDANIDFADFRRLLNSLGFMERIKGSHHIFTSLGVEEIINIQPKQNKAKPYQVKQVRNIILKYKLGASNE